MGQKLLFPFVCATRNRFLPKSGVPWKALGLGLFCLAVCTALYLTALKVVGYFHQQSELGIILSLKIFQMAWITLFSMLVFSCMVSAVSAVFLSQDNEIVFSAPVSPSSIYGMRFTTTAFYTSWMMILFSLPVFAAFGQVFEAGLLYWPLMLISLFFTAFSAVGFGMLITVILVNLFPARRTKDIIFYLSLCFAVFIYVMFRLMRPEDLANPDQFGHFVDYLSTISGPAGPYVPGAWAADFLNLYLMERQLDWLLLGLIITTPVSLFFLGEWAMQRMFFSGFSKAQESFGGYRSFRKREKRPVGSMQWLMRKELVTFLRDSTEWSQLFMIGALIVIYLYNFKVLPLDRSFLRQEYLANMISFLNIGLTGFVITSLSARFVFPSIGAEGGAFSIIRSSPLTIKRFLLYKYLFYCIPFTLLSVVLVVLSDYLLGIKGPIWWITIFASTILTWSVVAIGLGFGAMYADFKAENKAAALGSMGAILFLLVSLAMQGAVLVSGIFPAYRLTRKWLRHWPLSFMDYAWLGFWGVMALLLSGGMALYFVRKGRLNLEENG